SSRCRQLVGTVDDVGWDAAAGEAAGVGALGVVVAQVVGEVAAQSLEADLQVAGEGGPPAFVEDRLVKRLDGAVGLWTAGADACRSSAQALDGLLEAAAKLAAVIRQRPLEPPVGRTELLGHPAGKFRRLGRVRLPVFAADDVGPSVGGADVDRGQLPDGLLHVVEAADEEAVEADQLAWPLRLDVLLDGRRTGRLIGC